MKTLTISDWLSSSLLWLKVALVNRAEKIRVYFTGNPYVAKRKLVKLQKKARLSGQVSYTIPNGREDKFRPSNNPTLNDEWLAELITKSSDKDTMSSFVELHENTTLHEPGMQSARHIALDPEKAISNVEFQHDGITAEVKIPSEFTKPGDVKVSITRPKVELPEEDDIIPFDKAPLAKMVLGNNNIDAMGSHYKDQITDDPTKATIQTSFKTEVPELGEALLNILEKHADKLEEKLTREEVDQKRYYVSWYYPLGLTMLGKRTRHPVLVIDDLYNVEIEDLLKVRSNSEPYVIMGTRQEIMQKCKHVKDVHFDDAVNIDYIRKERLADYAKHVVTTKAESVHLFRHWFCTQVKAGNIKELDGHLFVDVFDNNGVLVKKADTKPEDFLYCHYDSLRTAESLKRDPEYYTLSVVADELMQRVLEVSFCVTTVEHITDIFDKPNTLIRNHSPSEIEAAKDFLFVEKPFIRGR